MRYPLTLRPLDGEILAEALDLPGCHALAPTEAGAIAAAQDALQTAVWGRVQERLPVPVPSPADGRPSAVLGLHDSLKLRLYWALEETGVSQAELARRLGKPQKHAWRLLDLESTSTLASLEEAFIALGYAIDVTAERRDAA